MKDAGHARADTETPAADDSAMVAALRTGDSHAAETFVRTHAPRMLAVARRFLANDADADDAVQDAFISALGSIHKFQGESQLGTWLHRIVVNAALMKLRKRKRRAEQSIDHLLPSFNEKGHMQRGEAAFSEPVDAMLMRDETRRYVRDRIEQLPEDYRNVILLRDIEEFDTRETAEILEVSEGAVKTRLHRARQALRSLLEEKLA